jgi:integrase
MSVTLRKRKNSDGSTTLLLDIYHNGVRKYEFLKELKLAKPSSLKDREKNKQNLEIAEKIAIKKAQELSAAEYDIVTDSGKKTVVVEWMQAYVDNYKKKDKRNLQGALNRFKHFLEEEKKEGLTFGRLGELLISEFQDYLREYSRGEGASSYFNRFKKMVKQAYRGKLIVSNPAAEVRTIGGVAQKKDTLTLTEIQTLAATPTESAQVKRAFLFSLVTGLRWIDVRSLTWQNINLSNKYMDVAQSKTDKTVRINLNDTAVKLLDTGLSAKYLFSLPIT